MPCRNATLRRHVSGNQKCPELCILYLNFPFLFKIIFISIIFAIIDQKFDYNDSVLTRGEDKKEGTMESNIFEDNCLILRKSSLKFKARALS